MNQDQDEDKFIKLITEAISNVVVPALDDMSGRLEEKLASKDELGEFRQDAMKRFDTMERKFDAQQNRLDKHNERIEALEKIHPKGKHDFVSV